MDKEGQKKPYRIGTGAAILVLAIAGIADIFTFIPFVGDFVGPIYWVCAALYFWSAGLGLVNWRKLVPQLLSFVGELIPAVQAFPTIFVATAIVITISRMEDKTGKSLMPGKALKGTRKPLNTGGARLPQNSDTMPTNEAGAEPQPLVVDGIREPR